MSEIISFIHFHKNISSAFVFIYLAPLCSTAQAGSSSHHLKSTIAQSQCSSWNLTGKFTAIQSNISELLHFDIALDVDYHKLVGNVKYGNVLGKVNNDQFTGSVFFL
jgi:hypothetical protein